MDDNTFGVIVIGIAAIVVVVWLVCQTLITVLGKGELEDDDDASEETKAPHPESLD